MSSMYISVSATVRRIRTSGYAVSHSASAMAKPGWEENRVSLPSVACWLRSSTQMVL